MQATGLHPTSVKDQEIPCRIKGCKLSCNDLSRTMLSIFMTLWLPRTSTFPTYSFFLKPCHRNEILICVSKQINNLQVAYLFVRHLRCTISLREVWDAEARSVEASIRAPHSRTAAPAVSTTVLAVSRPNRTANVASCNTKLFNVSVHEHLLSLKTTGSHWFAPIVMKKVKILPLLDLAISFSYIISTTWSKIWSLSLVRTVQICLPNRETDKCESGASCMHINYMQIVNQIALTGKNDDMKAWNRVPHVVVLDQFFAAIF